MSATPIVTLATDWSAWEPTTNHWTHVDVSMPDLNTDVIIATEDGSVQAGYFDDREWQWINSERSIKIGVTHWMPFPNPPVKEVK